MEGVSAAFGGNLRSFFRRDAHLPWPPGSLSLRLLLTHRNRFQTKGGLVECTFLVANPGPGDGNIADEKAVSNHQPPAVRAMELELWGNSTRQLGPKFWVLLVQFFSGDYLRNVGREQVPNGEARLGTRANFR